VLDGVFGEAVAPRGRGRARILRTAAEHDATPPTLHVHFAATVPPCRRGGAVCTVPRPRRVTSCSAS
jgi:hypothetical protein